MAAAPDRKGRVLVVEDEEPIRRFIRRALEPAYEVHEAAQGQEALNQARWARPDVILLDIRLPGFDGMTVLAKLKAHDETKMIPVVMVTGRGDTDALMACQRAGAVDHIIKPFNVEDLVKSIDLRMALRPPDPTADPAAPAP